MSDERSAFEITRARLEDIVSQVRRRDVTLEQSLDLLDEAVRLVNECNDLIDQTSFRASAAPGTEPSSEAGEAGPAPGGPGAAEVTHAPNDVGAVVDPEATVDDARE